MDYKLVALDLDGTLLADDKHIAESTLHLIEAAKARGVKFTVATGRMSRGAIRYAHQLGVDIPIVTYNGAIIRSLHNGDVYRQYNVPASGAAHAINLLTDTPVLRFVFVDDDVYTDTRHEWTDRYEALLGVEMRYVGDVRELLTIDPTMLVFMVPDLSAPELTRRLKSNLDSQVRITNSTAWFLDVLHPKASKGTALGYLSETLEIPREQIMAIGDNSNDLEMIEYAGLGVAVGNASDDLKAAADYVCEAEFNRGVEEAIERHILSVVAE